MDILSVRQGLVQQYQITLQNSSGPVTGVYTSADTLAALVWAGDTTPVLDAPTVSWINATEGTIQLTFQSADTLNMTPARYTLSVTVTHLGETVEGLRCWLDVTASPGTTATAPAYCAYSDMAKYYKHLQKLQTNPTQAGFADECGLARQWLDEIIINKASGRRMVLSPIWFGNTYYMYGRDPWLIEQLAANKLMVTSKVVEITAKKALSYVFKTAVPPTDKGHQAYIDMGLRFEREAKAAVKTLIAEFDLNGDGIRDIWYDLSVCRGRNH